MSGLNNLDLGMFYYKSIFQRKVLCIQYGWLKWHSCVDLIEKGAELNVKRSYLEPQGVSKDAKQEGYKML